jgi:hypothetical protein
MTVVRVATAFAAMAIIVAAPGCSNKKAKAASASAEPTMAPALKR